MIKNFFVNSIFEMWPSLVIVTVILICVRITHLLSHHKKFVFYKEFWMLVGILYMLLLYQLVTRVDLNQMSGFNIIPFKEIMRYSFTNEMFYYNVIGNIALFLPFGFIIALYTKPKHIWTNLIISVIVSSTIEFVQLNIGRSFDIDDIILNTIGCLLGYFVYKLFKKVSKKLPEFIKSTWFNNAICIIIIICVLLNLLGLMGIGLL